MDATQEIIHETEMRSPQTTAVIISCSGTLRYRLNNNSETSEDFSEQVTAKILL